MRYVKRIFEIQKKNNNNNKLMKCQYGEKIDINSLGLVSPFLRNLY